MGAGPATHVADIAWRSLGADQGLSNGSVNALAVDDEHLYIGTDAGLNVLDKVTGRISVRSVREGLPDPRVLSLLCDGPRLWIGTEKGLAVLQEGELKSFPGAGPLGTRRVNALTKVGDALLVGTPDGLIRYLPASGAAESVAVLAGQSVSSLRTDEQGMLIGLVNGNVRIYDLKEDTYEEVVLELNPLRSNVSAIGIGGDSVWFATDGNGVIEFDKLTRTWSALGRDAEVDRFLAALAEDGNYLWFGTFYGLYRYARKEDRWEAFSHDLLTKDAITALAVDGSKLWVGTAGSGLVCGEKEMPTIRVAPPKRHYQNETAEFSGAIKGEGPLSLTLEYCNVVYPDLWFSQYSRLDRTDRDFRARVDLGRLPDQAYRIRIGVTDAHGRENHEIFTLLKTTRPVTLAFKDAPVHVGANDVRGTFSGLGISRIVLDPGKVPAEIDARTGSFYAALTLTAEDRRIVAKVWDISGRSRQFAHEVQVAPVLGLRISALPDHFAPGSDQVQFDLAAQNYTEVEDWELGITTDEGIPVMTFNGEGPLPARITWNGKDQYGDLVEGGAKYLYGLFAREKNGDGITTPRQALYGKLVPKRRDKQVVVRLSNSLLFEKGKADIRTDSTALFDELMTLIAQRPKDIILVEGHTCDTPIHSLKYPSNLQLSEARALSVTKHLMKKHGIDPERISAVGYGESRPAVPNRSEANKAKNRRVEIVLMER